MAASSQNHSILPPVRPHRGGPVGRAQRLLTGAGKEYGIEQLDATARSAAPGLHSRLSRRTTERLPLVWFCRPLRERRGIRKPALLRAVLGAVLPLLLAASLSACGGAKGQDENEAEGTWTVDVLSASFPGKQHLAETSELRIRVKNLEQDEAVPNLAVTVDGFDQRQENRGFAEPRRPIWIVEEEPVNSTTAFTNTWAVGEVPAGETRTLEWKVTAVRAGTYTLRFKVAAGLDGKAKARLQDGSVPTGSFIARVSENPRPPKVD